MLYTSFLIFLLLKYKAYYYIQMDPKSSITNSKSTFIGTLHLNTIFTKFIHCQAIALLTQNFLKHQPLLMQVNHVVIFNINNKQQKCSYAGVMYLSHLEGSRCVSSSKRPPHLFLNSKSELPKVIFHHINIFIAIFSLFSLYNFIVILCLSCIYL